ncbi:MAG: mechanosensitive ion channel family protein [Candidatus Eisenbacteria bacterium]|uniref:Mechanosensitive ion channel family protein n=1 Tax=Eiseniibacteriota bacterium TaxID=2212470 RepID=A0A948RU67_UNCEI|nr:mechanosensitive ion channel family protein [Candidatus Eisenbacteria bacterium]MBU1949998.1 mechanosensitive ion channel family protein [Candidatus Eisenbacteria bacterium]MBU2691085.1 mechanosensitive ion channel family protein [Candidatus Eisenbacteria bacterium]
MEFINTILDYPLLGYTVKQLGLSFLIVVFVFSLKRFLGTVLFSAVRRLAARTKTELDDILLEAIHRPVEYLIVIIGLGVALMLLELPIEPYNLRATATILMKVLITLDILWLIFRILDALSTYLLKAAEKTESRLDDNLIPLFRKSFKVFIGILAFVMLIQNMGYSVSGLLAGLGIGGLAVGLAAKDTLANVFGSVAILFDHPFSVGDWIAGDGFEGVVEEIGFRSTRIRTFAKTQVSIPNQALANMTINNFSRMPRRRIKFTLGVTYKTSADEMNRAVEGIRGIIKEMPEIHDDFFLVNFTDFGASSLDILVYCFTKTTAWADHLEARQKLLTRIMQYLESMGLEVAFPTRSIYLESVDTDAEHVLNGPGADAGGGSA